MAAVVIDDIVGKTFEEFAEACTFIDNFLADGCHPCKHASRTTFAQFNNKLAYTDDRPRIWCKLYGREFASTTKSILNSNSPEVHDPPSIQLPFKHKYTPLVLSFNF